MFLGSDNETKTAQISWKFDFKECGLAVRQFKVKGRCSDDEDIEWRVIGDDRVGCRPLLGGEDGGREGGREGGRKKGREGGRG